MMLLVKVTEPTGVYAYMAIRAAQLGKGRPLGVTVALAATTALLSAFLDNLTTVLLMVPITFLLTSQSVEKALGGIGWPTLFFFLGLFVLVGALEHTGAIGEVADWIQEVTAGDRTAELLGIAWFAAVGGALIDNIPMTAAMIPVVEQIAAGTGDDDYWWALAPGACFGGNTTIVAAAANVAAAGMAEREGRQIGFIEFLKVGVPVTLVSMMMATAYIAVRYL
jgi:Na+/H+ antiporter NhaD/arsenite permease-like protein